MYDFANARIRGLLGRLLRPADVAALAGNADVGSFVNSLAGTDYGPDVEEARRLQAGLAVVDDAIRHNLARRVRDVLGFFEAERPGEATTEQRLVRVLLARADVPNLVGLVPGIAAKVSPAGLLAATCPNGLLSQVELRTLAEARSPAECLRLARQFGLGWASLSPDRWIGQRGMTATAVMAPSSSEAERTLRQEFVRWAGGLTRSAGSNGKIVRERLALEVDARNVVVALRIVRAAARPTRAQLADLLAPGGSLSESHLFTVARRPSLLRAVEALERTPFGRVLGTAGVETLLLDEVVGLEWAVERFVSRWARAQVFLDPLGIGLTVAYLAAKGVEARSLRLVARGLARHWPTSRVEQLLAA